MQTRLLSDIEAFQAEAGVNDWQFGFRAVKNGKLLERLRKGGRVWPETEQQIRAFILVERQARAKQGAAA